MFGLYYKSWSALKTRVCKTRVSGRASRYPTWWLGCMVGSELHGDAEVIVNGKLITGQHLWPGEAIGLHHWSAAVPHCFAQRAAGIDGPVQAHGRKQRTQEDLGVSVATLGQEGHPAASLLLDLCHSLMVQEVGQSHLLVANVVAKAQVHGYVHTLGLLGVEAAIVEVVRLPAIVVVLVRHWDGDEEEEGEHWQAWCRAKGALA